MFCTFYASLRKSLYFFYSSRRRHTRWNCDWSSDVCSSDLAQQIERRTTLPVGRRFHLGGTFVCHQAITSGQIDLYVEYTGTAYTAVLKHAPVADRDSVYRTVARDYAERFGLVWGKPVGF